MSDLSFFEKRRGARTHFWTAELERASLVLGLSAGVLMVASCNRATDAGDQKAALAAEAPPLRIETATAVSKEVPMYIDATGSFVAEESSEVSPQTSGWVVATPVDVGAFVEKGEVILQLDDSDARLKLQQAMASAQQTEALVRQAQAKIGLGPEDAFDPIQVPEVQAARASYESAQAEVRLAEADATRYANLVETGDVSRSNYEKQRTQAETAQARANAARLQYEAAVNAARQNYQGVESAEGSLGVTRAQVALAQKALHDTVVRAPLAGHVSARFFSVGEYVTSNSKVLTILRADPIKLELQVPEAEAGRLDPGMPVRARVAAYADQVFEGQVTVTNPAIDPGSRAMSVEAAFPNPEFALRPGMFSSARILLPATQKTVLIPRGAVLSDPNSSSAQAFVVDADRVRVRVVWIGEAEDSMVRILSGVASGEVVATSQLDQLYDGAPVLEGQP